MHDGIRTKHPKWKPETRRGKVWWYTKLAVRLYTPFARNFRWVLVFDGRTVPRGRIVSAEPRPGGTLFCLVRRFG